MVPVAADPGDDLGGWESCAWLDKRTGAPIKVTTGSAAEVIFSGAVRLRDLRTQAIAWARSYFIAPGRVPDPRPVWIEPSLIRWVGNRGRLLVAKAADPTADVADLAASYPQPSVSGLIREVVRLAGAGEMSRRFNLQRQRRALERIDAGSEARESTVAAVRRAVRRELGSERDWRLLLLDWARRQRVGTCALPGCQRPPRRAPSITCSEAHRKALTRVSVGKDDEIPAADPREAAQ